LEARWAVFLDALDIAYKYEWQGFELGSAGRYLPDFWLPDVRLWLEIKGQYPTEKERKKAERLFERDGNPVLIGVDEPYFGQLLLYCNDLTDSSGGAGWWPGCRWMVRHGEEGCNPSIAIGVNDRRPDRAFLRYDWSPLNCIEQSWLLAHHDVLLEAAIGARQARFEHGEKPGASL
jgi:hypothetical protein